MSVKTMQLRVRPRNKTSRFMWGGMKLIQFRPSSPPTKEVR